MTEKSSLISLSDGRRLAYGEYGDPNGKPVIYNHGLLASRFEAAFADDVAQKLGLRLISIDRPGYGRSDPKPDRTLLDWPQDVAALADVLRIPRFHLLGISGGGPYALACARELAGRVDGLTLICALGPPASLDELESGPGTRLFEFAGRHPHIARLALAPLGVWLRRSPVSFVERMMAAASPEDRAVLRDPLVRAGFARALREGARQGVAGALTDIGLYGRDWGFRLDDIMLPVSLWQGEADHTVPPVMAHYLAEHLPECEMHFVPKEGHFSLPVKHMPEILNDAASLNVG
ncbi:MAG: alpha/beta hydrolase [Gammaproteobacteria bacterium]